MNQLFIDKLHEAKTDQNAKLLESVEQMYRVCEQKAQLEALGPKELLLAGALGAGIGGVATNMDDISSYANEKKTELQQDAKDYETLQTIKTRTYEGNKYLGSKGWTYVDAADHPGLYRTDAFKGIPLDTIKAQPYAKVGWFVSPDKRKYYSTVTGEVYEMPEGQTFDDATSSNPGNKIGDTAGGTGEKFDPEDCSLSSKYLYGNDPRCGRKGYIPLSDEDLEWHYKMASK